MAGLCGSRVGDDDRHHRAAAARRRGGLVDQRVGQDRQKDGVVPGHHARGLPVVVAERLAEPAVEARVALLGLSRERGAERLQGAQHGASGPTFGRCSRAKRRGSGAGASSRRWAASYLQA